MAFVLYALINFNVSLKIRMAMGFVQVWLTELKPWKKGATRMKLPREKQIMDLEQKVS